MAGMTFGLISFGFKCSGGKDIRLLPRLDGFKKLQ